MALCVYQGRLEEDKSPITFFHSLSLAPNIFSSYNTYFSFTFSHFGGIMDWFDKFKFRKEMERMKSILYRIKRYLKLELSECYIRKCYKHEELKPFKLHKYCIPLKGQRYCVDFGEKKIFVTFSDSNYRCYVISFVEISYFEEFVKRLCRLYNTACYAYPFCC